MSAVLSFPDYKPQARRLAAELGVEYFDIQLHTFPDGESRITVPAHLPQHLIICYSLDHPNDKLINLIITAENLKSLGATQLTLIAPYLCYMRQDMAFQPGEAISQKIIGKLLADYFDNIVTVDAHLHRINSLDEAIPARQAVNLTAAGILGEFLVKQGIQAVLLGPDDESRQWVTNVAKAGNFSYGIAEKQRLGDNDVSITLPDIDVRNKTVVLIDDVISSGHTLAETARKLVTAGAAEVTALVTHALLAENAAQLLRKAGIKKVWSSDSVSHDSNTIMLSPLLADAIRTMQVN